MQRLLKNFEVASGLVVNFEKCQAFKVNVRREELVEMAEELGCQCGELPIPNLGLKVGGRLG